jgi:hypothetical protein
MPIPWPARKGRGGGGQAPAAPAEPAPRPAGSPALAPAGELLSTISALLLLACTFGLKWFGVAGRPGIGADSGKQSAAGAWTELSVVRWLVLLTAVVALGSVVIHISQRSHGSQTNTTLPVTLLGGLTSLLLFYRLLIDLPSPHTVVDVKLGGFLGLLSAIGIAFGGLESLRDLRHRRTRVLPRSRRPPNLAVDRSGR